MRKQGWLFLTFRAKDFWALVATRAVAPINCSGNFSSFTSTLPPFAILSLSLSLSLSLLCSFYENILAVDH